MSLIQTVTGDTFEADVVQSDIPVLIDFHAKWCGPCKAAEPSLNDIAREYEGEARIVKVDIDEEPSLTEKFTVKSVPTLILMHRGAIKERYIGSLTRGGISALIERHLDASGD